MLVVFGGLPGVGKSTVAREVARRSGAAYLRIDAIEQAVRDAGVLVADIGPAGYMAAYALARSNLELGRIVVADCVNPLPITRAAWQAVARDAGVKLVEVEVICSDAAEHRRRVENRTSDIGGLVLPTWAGVTAHSYTPWTGQDLVIDTATLNAEDAIAYVLAGMKAKADHDPV
ncbi:AAA family ATPase [Variovorax paradoxus]|nr:AAA family ATPase [Variovorax paradoxus]